MLGTENVKQNATLSVHLKGNWRELSITNKLNKILKSRMESCEDLEIISILLDHIQNKSNIFVFVM